MNRITPSLLVLIAAIVFGACTSSSNSSAQQDAIREDMAIEKMRELIRDVVLEEIESNHFDKISVKEIQLANDQGVKTLVLTSAFDPPSVGAGLFILDAHGKSKLSVCETTAGTMIGFMGRNRSPQLVISSSDKSDAMIYFPSDNGEGLLIDRKWKPLPRP